MQDYSAAQPRESKRNANIHQKTRSDQESLQCFLEWTSEEWIYANEMEKSHIEQDNQKTIYIWFLNFS